MVYRVQNLRKCLGSIILLISLAFSTYLNGQIAPGTYLSVLENNHHELKISANYLIYSVYSNKPAEFIKTQGGYYTVQDGAIKVDLEFNSNFEHDGVRQLLISFSSENDKLTLQTDVPRIFSRIEKVAQDLDGQWLFATRGPDEGQERRGDENPRKTLKFLIDGRFQWIAYHTETFDFSGTGGGTYTAKDGVYTEQIEYFSRDNTRVGALLNFNYEVKGTDWHHTGKNSKGEPLYEIWAKR
ncbi:MAG: hypothetical protein ACFCUL_05595 [Flavobacteriaceae bacterium]